MSIMELNGIWELYGRKECGEPAGVFTDGEVQIKAAVPGNIELDLAEAGLVADPYIGLNAMQLRKYEFYEWCCRREFEYYGATDNVEIVFEGLDCYAEIFVNGESVGKSENALIPHRFDVSAVLKNGKNEIIVHIASANNAFGKYPYLASTLSLTAFNAEVLRVRKPAHVWGWDIAPRMALGGIFRKVYLERKSAFDIEGYLQLERQYDDDAHMVYTFKIYSKKYDFEDLQITLDGVCKDSVFHAENTVFSAQGLVRFVVKNPELWYPVNYGEPSLYAVTVRLVRKSTSEVLVEKSFNYGIRYVRLKALPVATDSPEPDFQIFINNIPIRVLGFNHVPPDALHSRDALRETKILESACDLNCNMIRVWGGSIYENESFYDFCDRHGIMVWQDFMMACSRYPNDEDFCKVIAMEAESVIKRLRHHASIVMWCGDNECDCTTHFSIPRNPNENIITRKILPEVCRLHDGARPFLPSTPWCSAESVVQAEKLNDFPLFQVPEQHLWGGVYFKDDYYSKTPASFFSEIGYFGCTSLSSIRKFISADNVSNRKSDEWKYHAGNAYPGMNDGWSGRIAKMEEQLTYLFGKVPEKQEDFILASQITQAEALKYFIEFIRASAKRSGILWWNLADCWPQFSDAVIDYYFDKKLAYYYIKRLHAAVLVQVFDSEIIISNNSIGEYSGRYIISDADSEKIISEGDFEIGENGILKIALGIDSDAEQRMLLINWTLADGMSGVNHALCGKPHFSFSKYKKWLEQIAALDGSFDAEKIGK